VVSTSAPTKEPPVSTSVSTTEALESTELPDESVLCRFVRNYLGYNKNPRMRDMLLLADESGSIGWYNFEKIKNTFKVNIM